MTVQGKCDVIGTRIMPEVIIFGGNAEFQLRSLMW